MPEWKYMLTSVPMWIVLTFAPISAYVSYHMGIAWNELHPNNIPLPLIQPILIITPIFIIMALAIGYMEMGIVTQTRNEYSDRDHEMFDRFGLSI